MMERRDFLAAFALASVGSGAAAQSRAIGGGADAAERAVAQALGDLRAAGARGDGVTDDSAAVKKVAAEGAILFPRGVTRIERDVTIETYAEAAAGATLSLASGVTVTFAGGFWAPCTRVFTGPGQVVFRDGSQIVGHPEWWGARVGDGGFDNAPAISACVEACPVTQLQQGAYHVRSPIVMRRGGRTLRGVNQSQDVRLASSQIVVDGGEAGLVCGALAGEANTVDYLTLEDFAVTRGRLSTGGGDLVTAQTGIRFSHCALLRVTRVTARDHAVGFSVTACIECYFEQCSAMRIAGAGSVQGAVSAGFFLNYEDHSGATGGNASLYFDRCRAFGDAAGSPRYAAGLVSRGGFVDLYISRFETGFQHFGIDLQGDGSRSESFQNQDCQIANCVLDSNFMAGIRIRSAGRYCDVHISTCYIALGGASKASSCVILGGADAAAEGISGVVTATNCEFLGDFAGVIAANVAVCNLALNTYLSLGAPILFSHVGYSEIRDTARMLRPSLLPSPVVRLQSCEAIVVAVSASGVDDGYQGGVAIDATSSAIEVNCTRLKPATVGGAAKRIMIGGQPWGGHATFGERNIANGVI